MTLTDFPPFGKTPPGLTHAPAQTDGDRRFSRRIRSLRTPGAAAPCVAGAALQASHGA